MTDKFSTEIQLKCNITFSILPSVLAVENHCIIWKLYLKQEMEFKKEDDSASCVMTVAPIKLISQCQCPKTGNTDKYSCGLLSKLLLIPISEIGA